MTGRCPGRMGGGISSCWGRKGDPPWPPSYLWRGVWADPRSGSASSQLLDRPGQEPRLLLTWAMMLGDSSSLQDYQAGVAGGPRQAAGEVGAEEAPERRGHWGTSCGDRLKWSNWKN